MLIWGQRWDLSGLLLLSCLTLTANALAQDEREATVKQPFVATADAGRIVLSEGTFTVSLSVYRRHQRLLDRLEVGDEVSYSARGKELLTIRPAGEVPASDRPRRVPVRGPFNGLEQGSGFWWIVIGRGRYQLSDELYRQEAALLQFLKRGERLLVEVEQHWVMAVEKDSEEIEIPAEILELIHNSRRNEQVWVNGERYNFQSYNDSEVKLTPQLPTGEFDGTRTLHFREVQDFKNPLATERIAAGGSGVIRSDPFTRDNVQAGDTVGIFLHSGQIVELNNERCVLRVWKNQRWGESVEINREEVREIRRITLTSKQTIPLAAGELQIRVHRQRQARAGGLSFRVEASHNLETTILAGVQLRFHLGGVAMEVETPAESVEQATIPDVFAGDRVVIEHNAGEEYLDGRVEVVVGRDNVVMLNGPEAKPHILQALSKAPANDRDRLRQIYVAVGQNGDEELLRFVLDRALYPPEEEEGQQERHRELAMQGLQESGEKVAGLILSDLFFQDRNLKRMTLLPGELRPRSLAQTQTKAIPYKRRMIKILGYLADGPKGKNGERLFELYALRPEELASAIEETFRKRPDAAVSCLLKIATSLSSAATPDQQQRAHRATDLLQRLGDDVLPELIAELRRRTIPTAFLEQKRKLPGANPSQIVREALALLIKDAGRQRLESLDRMTTRAKALEVDHDWAGALALLEQVLEMEPTYAAGKERLAIVLLERAKQLRREGDRGQAGILFARAIKALPPAQQLRAKGPLGEIYLEAVKEEQEGVVVRDAPHDVATLVRMTTPGESFSGEEAENLWIRIQLGEDKVGFLRGRASRQAGPGRYTVNPQGDTPYSNVLKPLLDKTRSLSASLELQANRIEGHLLAREAVIKYEVQDYEGALPLFEQAREWAPDDPRLELEKWCWAKANLNFLAAAAGLFLLMSVFAAMSMVRRPKKVKFSGEFKHYGADRTRRERDLEVGDEEEDLGS